MKRWAICRMVEGAPDEWEPAIAAYPVSWRLIHSEAWGRVKWVIVQFAAQDLTPIQADVNIKILPDATLDSTFGSLPTAVRNRVKTELAEAGFTATVQNAWTIRQVLNYIGRQIDASFSCEAGDVKDLP